jgi:hypothetical protein
LNSLSDLIVKLALTPGMQSRRSLGVSRADTRTMPGADRVRAGSKKPGGSRRS